MIDFVVLAIGIELTKKMKRVNLLERFEAANTLEAKTAIVQETEKMTLEVVNDIFKPESEIGEEGVEVKDEVTKDIIEHNYEYFEIPSPFEQGLTLDDIKKRNGYGVVEADEFFA